MAAKNGCTDAARLLLAHGAFIEAKANVHILMTFFSGSFRRICIKDQELARLPPDQTFLFQMLLHAEWNDTITSSCLVLTAC